MCVAIQEGAGGRQAPTQVIAELRSGVMAGALPLMRASLEAALREIDQSAATRPPSPTMVEDRADLALLLREVLGYERRWQQNVDAVLKDWPNLPRASSGGFELVADDELQAQLVGASVVDALERHFADPVGLLDQRLYSLAARMGATERPRNPFAPRSLAESFLRAFTTLDASVRVQALVLKHFSKLASDRLGPVYRAGNALLADAGYELASGNEGVLVFGTGRDQTHWRLPEETTPRGGANGDRLRAALMHRHRPAVADAGDNRRSLRDEELQVILSLLQAEPEPSVVVRDEAGTAETLRLRIQEAGASIGIPRDSVNRSAQQDASVEVVGRLVDALLANAALSARDARTVARMALPLLRAALDDPGLFDDPTAPVLGLAGALVRLADGNAGRTPAERELGQLFDAAASEWLADQQGDPKLPGRWLARIGSAESPLHKRAELAAKRASQSLLGKERLEAARREADLQLQRLFDAGPMSPVLAGFLAEYWRHWLAQTWLREGRDSERFREAVGLGDRLLALDAETDGHRLAQDLLALEPLLRDSIATSGLQGDGALAALSALIADFANPDRTRTIQQVSPMAREDVRFPADHADAVEGVEIGDRLVRRLEDGTSQALQLAWRSPLTGRYLLVDEQGAQAELLETSALSAGLADGSYLHRAGGDPMRAALARLQAALATDTAIP